jgi:hypothetical protein
MGEYYLRYAFFSVIDGRRRTTSLMAIISHVSTPTPLPSTHRWRTLVLQRHAAANPSFTREPVSAEAALSFRHATAEMLIQGSGAKFEWRLSNTSMTRRVATYLRIVAAEKVFRLVEPGTHTFSKSFNPEELINFFTKHFESGAHPWISWTYALLVTELRGSGGERNTSTPPAFNLFPHSPIFLLSFSHIFFTIAPSPTRTPAVRMHATFALASNYRLHLVSKTHHNAPIPLVSFRVSLCCRLPNRDCDKYSIKPRVPFPVGFARIRSRCMPPAPQRSLGA